ncbi:MAG TPA: hypothetical protein VF145_05200 [Chitinophagaceae bacterium]
MKKLYYIALIVVLGVATYLLPELMIGPGKLAASHNELSKKCLSCHQPFGGVPDSKCISCHKLAEIGVDSATRDSSAILAFHQHLQHVSCTACHTDHNGAEASLTTHQFNHDLLPAATLTTCQSCHITPRDKLHTTVKAACNSCHNTSDWKDVAQFDHAVLDKVMLADCASCHPAPDDTYHRQLTGNCSQCHSTSAWKPSTFRHDEYFILDRDHNVSCVTCHPGNNLQRYTCYGCHEHTPANIAHEHEEENITNLDDCASCHRSANEHDIRRGQRDRRIEEYIRENNGRRKKDKGSDHDDD